MKNFKKQVLITSLVVLMTLGAMAQKVHYGVKAGAIRNRRLF